MILCGVISFGVFGQNLSVLNALTTMFMYVMPTQAWNILGGYGGYLNFGMVTFLLQAPTTNLYSLTQSERLHMFWNPFSSDLGSDCKSTDGVCLRLARHAVVG